MQVLVSINSAQRKVSVGSNVVVDHIKNVKPGDKVEFDKVLAISDGDKTLVGTPVVPKAKVVAEVVGHKKAPKVLVFKKRSKKGYKKIRGHRQSLTELIIKEIKI
ncbi:MAG: 50S ribosomal protein L21 [Elusimicrobia bacterium HGW-Elusimicrobia-1]|jgi:large subunit ribosomal protein L21|nr:MAG: 50S ribosomal protein L21 [Elusimicrobia bacterium HGW-Elusimicrobia-1]